MVAIVYTESVGAGPDWLMAKPNKQVFDYLSANAKHAMQNITASAQEFIQTAGEVYQAINYSDAMRKARAVIRTVSNAGTLDVIKELTDVGQLQNARPVMQQYIMADPVVRNLYHNQGCDGYSGSYVDNAPGMSGADHYDYRRVMHGMWHEDESDGRVKSTLFYEDKGDDEDLDAIHQMDILRTWDYVRSAIKRGKEDPTSPENDML